MNKVGNILLIMPKYFGYESLIKNELKRRFNRVAVIYENYDHFNKLYVVAKGRAQKLCRSYEEGYYTKRLAAIDFEADVVVIIRGNTIGAGDLDLLKSRFKRARFVLYEWDSVKNLKNADMLSGACSLVQTFDPVDSKREGWGYLPLFYHARTAPDAPRDIDVCFVGALHSGRAQLLNRITEECRDKGWVLFDHIYSNGTRIGYFRKRYITKNDKYYSILDKGTRIRFAALSLNEMDRIYSRSRVVVDFAHPDQSGLTMRTIECLGNSCKLVTNNRSVLEADFYDERNIHVFEGHDLEIPEHFIDAPYHPCSDKIAERYSLETWIGRVLGL